MTLQLIPTPEGHPVAGTELGHTLLLTFSSWQCPWLLIPVRDAEVPPPPFTAHRSGAWACEREFSWLPASLRVSMVLSPLVDLPGESKTSFKALGFPGLGNPVTQVNISDTQL